MSIIPLIAYLLGSVPSAYLIVKLFTGKNITAEGSGNVGAMNSYESTGKKHIGLLVFGADFLKGLVPLLLLQIFDAGQIEMSLAGIFLIIGHNFSVFLKFKGGKGLATALGVFATINLFPIIVWVAVWVSSYKFLFKDINKTNIAATTSLLSVWLLPDSLLHDFAIMSSDPLLVRIMISAIASLIMFKHIKDIKEIMAK